MNTAFFWNSAEEKNNVIEKVMPPLNLHTIIQFVASGSDVPGGDTPGNMAAQTFDMLGTLIPIFVLLFLFGLFFVIKKHKTWSKQTTSIFVILLASIGVVAFSSSAFALHNSSEYIPSQITAYVNKDTGEIQIDSATLNNISDANLELTKTEVKITEEGSSVDALKNSNLFIEGLDTELYNDSPDGIKIAQNAKDLDVGDTSLINFNLTNIKKDDALSLIDKKALEIDFSFMQFHRIDFNGNGNDSGEPPTTMKLYKDDEITVPTQGSLKKIGYEFKEWNTKPDGTGTSYNAGDTLTNFEETTLYAIWDFKEINVDVAFDENYEGGKIQHIEQVLGTTYILPSSDPSREKFRFLGWFTEQTGGVEVDKNTQVTKETAHTIYAHWVELVTLSFDMHDHGQPISPITVDKGSIVEQPSDPEEIGWDFGGWFTSATYETAFNFSQAIYENTSAHAKWTIKTYNVVFDVGSVAVPPSNQHVAYGQKATNPGDPSLAGHEFGGWYKDSEYTIPWDFDTFTITGNTVIYGKWIANKIPVKMDLDGGKSTTPPTNNGWTLVDGTTSQYIKLFDYNTKIADIAAEWNEAKISKAYYRSTGWSWTPNAIELKVATTIKPVWVSSESIELSGYVVDDDDVPVANANVDYIKEDGTIISIFTGYDGRYKIVVPKSDVGEKGLVKIYDSYRVAPDIKVEGVDENTYLGKSVLSASVKVYGVVDKEVPGFPTSQIEPIPDVQVTITTNKNGIIDTYQTYTNDDGYYYLYTKELRDGVITFFKDNEVQYIDNISIVQQDIEKNLRLQNNSYKVYVDLNGGNIQEKDVPPYWNESAKPNEYYKEYWEGTNIQAVIELWNMRQFNAPVGKVLYGWSPNSGYISGETYIKALWGIRTNYESDDNGSVSKYVINTSPLAKYVVEDNKVKIIDKETNQIIDWCEATTDKDGYEFKKWTINGQDIADEGDIETACTFKANFGLKEYELSFSTADVRSGSVSADEANAVHNSRLELAADGTIKVSGAEVCKPEPKPGYHFDHWVYQDTELITSNMTFVAYFSVNEDSNITYRVQFVDGKALGTITENTAGCQPQTADIVQTISPVSSVAPVGVTATPISGYKFSHWTKESWRGASGAETISYNANFSPKKELGYSWDTEDGIYVSDIYTAYFVSEDTTTISYLATDGGYVTRQKDNFVESASPQGSEAKPLGGHHFVKWINFSTGEKVSDTAVFVPSKPYAASYEAIFEPDTHQVIYDKNSSEATGVLPSSQTKVYGKNIVLADNSGESRGSLSWSHHVLNGWNTKRDGTGEHYDLGATYSSNQKDDQTLYAEWEFDKHTLTIRYQYQDGSPAHKTYTAQLKHEDTYSVQSPNIDGFSCSQQTVSGTMGGEDITVTVTYTPIIYTITYNSNNAQQTTLTQNKNYNVPVTLKGSDAFTSEGYHIVSWNTNADGTGIKHNLNTSYTSNSNLTLYAIWEINVYTITYHNNFGTPATIAKTVQHGNQFKVLTQSECGNGFVQEGWQFSKWKTNNDEYYECGASYTINSNIDLYAVWVQREIIVTLDAGDGEFSEGVHTATLNRHYGDRYNFPDNPSFYGYDFTGWFTEKNGGTQLGTNDAISRDYNHTLYAHWEPKSITVTLEYMDSVTSPTRSSFTTKYGSIYELPQPIISPFGKQFVGWFTLPNGGDEVKTGDKVLKDSDHTLYGHWVNKKINVKFNFNDATTSPTVIDTIQTCNELYDFSKITSEPTREGYLFRGWYTEGNKEITASSVVEIETDHTLYAHWDATKVIIHFSSNSGSKASPDYQTDATLSYLANYSFSNITTPTWDSGHRFTGWYDQQQGGNLITTSTQIATYKEHTLYAHWDIDYYTIQYDSNGGASAPSNQTKEWGVDLNLSDGTGLTKTGYTLTGWNTEANGSGQPFSLGAVYSANASIKLYAQWSAKTQNVTFHAVDGSFADGSNEKTLNQTYGVQYNTPENPTLSEWGFSGWYSSTAEDASYINVTSNYVDFNVKDLYAHYEQNIFSLIINYVDTNNNVVASQFRNKYEEGAEYSVTSPSPKGYTIRDDRQKVISGVMPKADVNVTVIYNENTCNIKYLATEGGTVSSSSQIIGVKSGKDEDQKDVGSIASANEEYKFISWMKVVDESDPSKDIALEGGTSLKFIPPKNIDGLYENATYRVHFDRKTFTLTFASSSVSAGQVSKTSLSNIPYGTIYEIDNNGTINFTYSGMTFEPITISIIDPSYKYSDWQVSNPDGNTIKSNLSYTANFEKQKFNLHFAPETITDSNPGKVDKTILSNVEYGTTYQILEDGTFYINDTTKVVPLPKGESGKLYKFVAWENLDADKTIVSEKTYTAKFEEVKYSVTFKTNDGNTGLIQTSESTTPGESQTLEGIPYNTQYSIDAFGKVSFSDLPSKYVNVVPTSSNGYIFDHWDKSATGNIASNNIVFTAYFKLQTFGISYNTGKYAIPQSQDLGTDTKTWGQSLNVRNKPQESITRRGYVFSAWTTDEDCGEGAVKYSFDDGVITTNNNITLYPYWELNKNINVTFDYAYGNKTSSITHIFGQDYQCPTDTTRDGYIFDGWYTKLYSQTIETRVDDPVAKVDRDTDHTVTAHWSARSDIKVTFDFAYDSKSEVINQTFNASYIFPTPQPPVRDGYTFGGWWIKAGGQDYNKRIDTNPVAVVSNSSDHTARALWTGISTSATYHANGGKFESVSPDSEIVSQTYGNNYVLPSSTLVNKVGHTFAGWWTSQEGGTQITDQMVNYNKNNFDVYAHWSPMNVKVSFYCGDNIQAGSTQTVYTNTDQTYGAKYNFPNFNTSQYESVGYSWAGWYYDEACTNPVGTDDVVINTSNHNIYGKFVPMSMAVTYDPNGGTIPGKNPGESKTIDNLHVGINYQVPSNPSKDGYIFTGWYASGSDVKIDSNTKITTYVPTQTLYAHWTPATNIIVSFYLYEGAVETIDPIAQTFNSKYKLPQNSPTREGYEFAFWTYNGETITTDSTVTTSTNHTLYAVWTPDVYTITYHQNGGTGSVPSGQTQTRDVAYTIQNAPTDLNKTGYDFAGWNTSSDGNGDAYIVGQSYTPNKNLDLYAQWTPKQINVLFKANGGEFSDKASEKKVSQTYDSQYVFPESPSWDDGHSFVGWYTASDSGDQIKSTDIYKGFEGPVYAHWAENLCIVTINYKCDNVSIANSVTLSGSMGSSYSQASPDVKGYTCPDDQKTISGIYTTDETINVNYTENTVEISYTVNDASFGTVSVESQTVGVVSGKVSSGELGSTAQVIDGIGSQFVNWTKQGTTDVVSTTAKFTPTHAEGEMFTATTYVANFEIAKIQLKFESNNTDAATPSQGTLKVQYNSKISLSGDNSTLIITEPFSEDEAYTVSINFKKPESYDFNGWTNLNLDHDTKVELVTSAKTYIINMSIKKFDLSFVSADSSHGSVSPAIISQVEYGTTFEVLANGNFKLTSSESQVTVSPSAGYEFDKWGYKLNGVSQDDIVAGDEGTIVGASTFTANFKLTILNIRLFVNPETKYGKIIDPADETRLLDEYVVSVPYGSEYSIDTDGKLTFIKPDTTQIIIKLSLNDGYIYRSWGIPSDVTKIVSSDEWPVSFKAITYNIEFKSSIDNSTIDSISGVPYASSYDINDVKVSIFNPDSQTIKEVSAPDKTQNTPRYLFTNWSVASNNSSENATAITTNLVFTANYINAYKLSFTSTDFNCGKINDSSTAINIYVPQGTKYKLGSSSDEIIVTEPDKAGVVYKAIPVTSASGQAHKFSGWTPTVTNTDTVVSKDVNFAASFANVYTLSFVSEDDNKGIVSTSSDNPIVVDEGITYEIDGNIVNLYKTDVAEPFAIYSADAKEGYTFASWTTGLLNNLNANKVSVSSNMKFTAHFNQAYKLSFEAGEHGSISSSQDIWVSPNTTFEFGKTNVDNDTIKIYNTADHNNPTKVIATPDNGYRFNSWTKDPSTAKSPVTQNIKFTANFAEAYTLSFSVDSSCEGMGEISPSSATSGISVGQGYYYEVIGDAVKIYSDNEGSDAVYTIKALPIEPNSFEKWDIAETSGKVEINSNISFNAFFKNVAYYKVDFSVAPVKCGVFTSPNNPNFSSNTLSNIPKDTHYIIEKCSSDSAYDYSITFYHDALHPIYLTINDGVFDYWNVEDEGTIVEDNTFTAYINEFRTVDLLCDPTDAGLYYSASNHNQAVSQVTQIPNTTKYEIVDASEQEQSEGFIAKIKFENHADKNVLLRNAIGFILTGWSVDEIGSITDNMEICSQFKLGYRMNFNVNGDGQLKIDDQLKTEYSLLVDGNTTFYYDNNNLCIYINGDEGSLVTIEPASEGIIVFTGWTTDPGFSPSPITSDITFTANFKATCKVNFVLESNTKGIYTSEADDWDADSYTLSDIPGGAQINVNAAASSNMQSVYFSHLQETPVKLVPNVGLSLSQWEITKDGEILDVPLDGYVLDGDITVKAYFKEATYQVTFDVVGPGSLNVTSDKVSETGLAHYEINDIEKGTTFSRGFDSNNGTYKLSNGITVEAVPYSSDYFWKWESNVEVGASGEITQNIHYKVTFSTEALEARYIAYSKETSPTKGGKGPYVLRFVYEPAPTDKEEDDRRHYGSTITVDGVTYTCLDERRAQTDTFMEGYAKLQNDFSGQADLRWNYKKDGYYKDDYSNKSVTKIFIDPSMKYYDKLVTCERMFADMTNLVGDSIEGLEYLNMQNVTSTYEMFSGVSNPTKINCASMDVSNVTTFYGMFKGCENAEEIDVSSWDIGKGTAFSNMFNGCSNLKVLNCCSWHFNEHTSSQATTSNMFFNCTSLENIYVTSQYGDWTQKIKGDVMFTNCSQLPNFDKNTVNETKAYPNSGVETGYLTLKYATLFYNANNATAGTVPHSQTVISSGDAVVISGNSGNLKRVENGVEYTFAGWNTSPTGEGKTYMPGEEYALENDITLYAKWVSSNLETGFSSNEYGSISVSGTENIAGGCTYKVNDDGSITFSNGSELNYTLTVMATPNPGYELSYWLMGNKRLYPGDTGEYTRKADFKAVFDYEKCQINFTEVEHGTAINPNPVKVYKGSTYIAEADPNNPTRGKITFSSSAGIDKNDVVVYAIAIRQNGYLFDKWNGKDKETGTINSDTTFTASFRLVECKITFKSSSSGKGSFTENGEPITSDFIVSYGTEYTITKQSDTDTLIKFGSGASARTVKFSFNEEGWDIVSWNKDDQGTIFGSSLFSVKLKLREYKLSFNKSGSGTVPSQLDNIQQGTKYKVITKNENGKKIGKLTLIPPEERQSEYSFVPDNHWEFVECSSYEGTIKGDLTLNIIFKLITYTLSFDSSNPNFGKVSLNDDLVVDYGTKIDFNKETSQIKIYNKGSDFDYTIITAMPESTYKFAEWSSSVETVGENITSNIKFSASFIAESNKVLHFMTDGRGDISPDKLIVGATLGSSFEIDGANIKLNGEVIKTATVNANKNPFSKFVKWTCDAEGQTVQDDIEFVAHFENTNCTVTISADEGQGSVDKSSVEVPYGTSYEVIKQADNAKIVFDDENNTVVNINAEAAYKFKNITVNPMTDGINQIKNNTEIVAKFEHKYVNVAIDSDQYSAYDLPAGWASSIPYGSKYITNGTSLKIINSISGDVVEVIGKSKVPSSHTFDKWMPGSTIAEGNPITSDTTFTATSKLNVYLLEIKAGENGTISDGTTSQQSFSLSVTHGTTISCNALTKELTISGEAKAYRPEGDTGYVCKQWDNITTNITVERPLTLTAQFELDKYNVSFAKPNDGYYAIGNKTQDSYTDVIDSPSSEIGKYQIELDADLGTAVYKNDNLSYNITAVPFADASKRFKFSKWTINGEVLESGTATYNIQGDVKIVPTYEVENRKVWIGSNKVSFSNYEIQIVCDATEPTNNAVTWKEVSTYSPTSSSSWGYPSASYIQKYTIDSSMQTFYGFTSFAYMFNGMSNSNFKQISGLEYLKTYNATNMNHMFYNCKYLTSLDVSKFNTDKVTDMNNMFYYASKVTALDVSGFNTSQVTNMSYMFSNCSIVTQIDCSNWNVGKVTNMNYMFYYCTALSNIWVAKSGVDWEENSDTATGTNMFTNCKALSNYDSKYTGIAQAHCVGEGSALGYFSIKDSINDDLSSNNNIEYDKQISNQIVDNEQLDDEPTVEEIPVEDGNIDNEKDTSETVNPEDFSIENLLELIITTTA